VHYRLTEEKDTIAMTRTGTPDVGDRIATASAARDLVLLLARIGLGVLMVAHAKLEYDFAGGSIAGVGALFQKFGVPLAVMTGPVNVLFELIGGAAMILGLAVLPVGVLMALNMVGAWIFVHTGSLYALDHNIDRLAEDHANASALARGLAQIPGVSVEEPETNLVFFDVREAGLTAEALEARLRAEGVMISAMGHTRARACTHLDVDRAGIETAIEAIRRAVA